MEAEAFDAWASSLCEEIVGVKRDVWDIFARQRFLNEMLKEGIVTIQEENGTIVLTETEDFSSDAELQPEIKASDAG